MKKVTLIAMILVYVSTYGQKTKLGISSGISIANYTSKVDGRNESGNSLAGYTGGIFADVSLGKHISLQPALNFVQKGSKYKYTVLGYSTKSQITVNLFEVPINLLYNSRGKTVNVFAGLGPSIAFGVGGKAKSSDPGGTYSEKVKFGTSDDATMRRVDAGINILAGITLKGGFMFAVNYNGGVTNLFPHGEDDGTLRSRYFGIRLGYMLPATSK
ncbi:MAG TPA: porin family protein [Ferruginibacter sp.]|nr:porin family protein [Ferruginibacter sp.]HNN72692.1 porin family protein [Ferruginibacter sp.]